ncbi:MAG: TlpA family protein disulfide reductase [Flavobacteriia bacterium]|nr:TlpA family protein disulfide reductase [Flavobacteriia bacterium]
MKTRLLIVFIFTSFASFAQDTIYTNSIGVKYSRSELIESVHEFQLTLPDGKYVQAEIVHEVTEIDSIVLNFSFLISSEEPKDLIIESSYLPSLGTLFPDFTFSSDTSRMLSSYYGKPILINFWYTGCPHCVTEIPVLNEFQEKYKDQMTFIAITFESDERVQEFLKEYQFNFIHHAEEWEIQKTLNLDSYPSNIILNSNGEIVRIFGGVPYNIVGGQRVIGEGPEIENEIIRITSANNTYE